MPRSRQLKLSVFEDPVIGSLSPQAFKLMLAIWQHCRPDGSFSWGAFKYWRHAFAYDGSIAAIDVGSYLDELQGKGVIDGQAEHRICLNFAVHNDVKSREAGQYERVRTSGNLSEPVPTGSERPSESVQVQESTKKKKKSTKASTVPISTPGFEQWYEAYPRHKAKGDAAKAYQKRLKEAIDKRGNGRPGATWKEVDPELSKWLIECVAYQQGFKSGDGLNRDPNYCPYPATWLNKEGFRDEPED